MLTLSSAGPILAFTSIESLKAGPKLPGLAWLPFLSFVVGQIYGVGITFPILLIPATLLSFALYERKGPRPSPSPAHARIAELSTHGAALASLATTLLPLKSPHWDAVNIAFQVVPLVYIPVALASLGGRSVAQPQRSKAAANVYRRFAVLIMLTHFLGIALVGHGRFVLKERLTPGSYAILLDMVGVTVGVFLLATATPIPGRENVLRFVRRTITGGPAYAGFCHFGDRETAAASALVRKDMSKKR